MAENFVKALQYISVIATAVSPVFVALIATKQKNAPQRRSSNKSTHKRG